MGIDKKTKPKFLSITFPDNREYFNMLRSRANEEGYNDEEEDQPKCAIDSDDHHLETYEYYFDGDSREIVYSGGSRTSLGDGYVYFSLPLSDELLIDILNYALRRYNKLKTAMESLK